jgi:hypothetical protein
MIRTFVVRPGLEIGAGSAGDRPWLVVGLVPAVNFMPVLRGT